MIKVCTASYVFKFVGGDKTARLCHYCRKSKLGGMICVYGNTETSTDDTLFVCPGCAARGCRESEQAWNRLVKTVKKTLKKKEMSQIDPVLVEKLSKEIFEKLYPMALDLVRPVESEHGAQMAANVLTNALVSTTAWQMGNHMSFMGVWDSDEERQDYCTKMGEAIFAAFINLKPKAT